MIRVSRKYAANEERTLLSALILNSSVLERVRSHLNGGPKPFRSKWSNLVADWCFEYHAKHGKAPRKSIHLLFERYAGQATDEKSVETIENYLSGLSEEMAGPVEDLNEEFLVDLASRYFQRVRLERVSDELQEALEREDIADAQSALSKFTPLAFATNDWIDPTSPEVVLEALQAREGQELIQFRGDLGRFLQPHFERDGFIAFVGPEKRGKSFWLMEVVWQAMIQRRKVLYYVVGDMSKPQVMRRLITRAIRRPLRAGTIERPIRIEKLSQDKVRVESKTQNFPEPVSLADAVRSMGELLNKTGAAKSRLRLKCCGGSSLSATDIENDVRTFIQQGWIPDVVVADYADLLAPEPFTKNQEYRHQVNESWKIMRRVSQNHHLLFVTATQAAASSYASSVIRKTDFSEDKRKNAHVTGMLGINQTTEEKKLGIYRLNWVFLRDGAWTDTQVVTTAGNLGLCCPCLSSVL